MGAERAITYGAQYFRPPFPRQKHWADDLAKMRDSGLNTVQLWLVWAWIESDPGTFAYDDYDELIAIADRVGLSVVLSTIAAIHPYWIHREVPGSEMITNLGERVISTNRRECHFGLTPGGCIDHPGIRERMGNFLGNTAKHYADSSVVAGWDVWNELRWNVHSDGLVCYCDHTRAAYTSWLKQRYDDLEQLNQTWERRYSSWEDVLPGKKPDRPYTDMIAYSEFLSERSVSHARDRYQIVKKLDPTKPVTVHGGKPTVLYGEDSYYGEQSSTALHRGNDWGFAEMIDGVGTSSFPAWEAIDLEDFTSRIDCVAAAARYFRNSGTELWLSELQGGRSADGFTQQVPVTAAAQQRWAWSGIAAGATTILYWCWRDEIFGRESGGFGIDGNDGHAEQRIAAHKVTGAVLEKHGRLLREFRPDSAPVGVWFSPRTYYLEWSQRGDATRAMHSIQGVCRALVRQSIPYTIVEEDHLDRLDELSLIYMPRTLVLDQSAHKALARFIDRGGVLVTESECGAFSPTGIYRYPEERFVATEFGLPEAGRRTLAGDAVEVTLGLPIASAELGLEEREVITRTYLLPALQWITPLRENESPLGAPGTRGDSGPSADAAGAVICLPSYHAEAYYEGSRNRDPRFADTVGEFERLIADLCAWGAGEPEARIVEATAERPLAHVRVGSSGQRRMLFVITEEPERSLTVVLSSGEPDSPPELDYTDLISGATFRASASEGTIRLALPPSAWGVYALVSGSE